MNFAETVRSHKIASAAAAGVLAFVGFEVASSHVNNKITVSQGKTCEGTIIADTSKGEPILDIATEHAIAIGVDPSKAAYIGEFILKSNDSTVFYTNQDGELASTGKPIVTPESCNF